MICVCKASLPPDTLQPCARINPLPFSAYLTRNVSVSEENTKPGHVSPSVTHRPTVSVGTRHQWLRGTLERPGVRRFVCRGLRRPPGVAQIPEMHAAPPGSQDTGSNVSKPPLKKKKESLINRARGQTVRFSVLHRKCLTKPCQMTSPKSVLQKCGQKLYRCQAAPDAQ